MKPVARMDCKIDDIYYDKGEEIEVKDKEQLIKLNENGFIEPMTMKQIQDYFKKSKINLSKKEEVKDERRNNTRQY